MSTEQASMPTREFFKEITRTFVRRVATIYELDLPDTIEEVIADVDTSMAPEKSGEDVLYDDSIFDFLLRIENAVDEEMEILEFKLLQLGAPWLAAMLIGEAEVENESDAEDLFYALVQYSIAELYVDLYGDPWYVIPMAVTKGMRISRNRN